MGEIDVQITSKSSAGYSKVTVARMNELGGFGTLGGDRRDLNSMARYHPRGTPFMQ